MKAISHTGNTLPVGNALAVFTNTPEPVGAEFNVVDRSGHVLNIARVTHVTLSSDINLSNGKKYVVQAKVIQDLSAEQAGPFDTRIYWT